MANKLFKYLNWNTVLTVLVAFACFDSSIFSIYLIYNHTLSYSLLGIVIAFLVAGIATFALWVAVNRKLTREMELKIQEAARFQSLEYHKQVMENELNVARRIQKALYPKKEDISDPRFDIYGVSVASNKISGDYFDIFLSDEIIYFGIGDVTGHGLSSSIVSVLANRKFRSYVKLGITHFPTILEDISKEIAVEGSKNMSILLGYIDRSDCIHLYGRQETLIVCNYHGIETHNINESGFMIGTTHFDKTKIPYFSVILEPDDFMIMYSDGLTESENEDKMAIGLKLVVEYINSQKSIFRTSDSHQIAQAILKFVGDWKHGKFEDDITLLIIKRK